MQAGTWGVTLPIQTDLDLTNTTAVVVKIIPPNNGTPVVRTLLPTSAPALVIAPPGSQGIINYTVQQTDFPTDGLYQLEVTDTTVGRAVPTSPIELYVYPNI